jgi:hypothetical protein
MYRDSHAKTQGEDIIYKLRIGPQETLTQLSPAHFSPQTNKKMHFCC